MAETMLRLTFDEVLHRTEKGGTKLRFGRDEVWVPEAACPELDSYDVGDGGSCQIPRRLAEDKGLEGFCDEED